ncbi:MAG: hypothetical protein JOZ01_06630 [Candidatus Eremiobacteraeota bacterium]|nr:hypothetical protein [Candidatus Eremiobacteraeota bacterium]
MKAIFSALCTATATAFAVLATVAIAQAATIPSGTKVLCVLGQGVNSATLKTGTNFKLHVDDPTLPSLAGAAIVGHVTDVGGTGGMTRARIGFRLDYIAFKNGTRAAIHAVIVSKSVTQTNTAVARQEQVKFSLPAMPNGTVTPGPIAWQMNFRRDAAPSVTPPPAGNTSGYVYAQKSNENIVIPPGAPVTIQLTSNLTTP